MGALLVPRLTSPKSATDCRVTSVEAAVPTPANNTCWLTPEAVNWTAPNRCPTPPGVKFTEKLQLPPLTSEPLQVLVTKLKSEEFGPTICSVKETVEPVSLKTVIVLGLGAVAPVFTDP